MRPPKHVWPETDGSRGILIFAQLMREMLTATTFESFRVYSLDTIARLREALILLEDVKRGRVPSIALTPVVEELRWSFSKDTAAKEFASDEISSLEKLTRDKKSFSVEAFESHIKLIQKLISDRYKEKLENLILSIFNDSKQRIELRKLAGFYCSHIVNLGYARRYILGLVEEFFFENEIHRIGRATLGRFFREFDGKKRRFIVHAAVTHDLGAYLGDLDYHVRSIDNLTEEQSASLLSNPNHQNIPEAIEVITEQFDPHGAMNFVYQNLSSQRAIAYLDPRGMHCEWGDTMHVTLSRAQSGVRITRGDFLFSAPAASTAQSGNRLKSIRNYAKFISSSFDSSSTERLISSINTAAIARNSVNPENQLISFWSAIEVLLSDPQDESRITHYEKLIVPCIALRHARRQIIAVYEGLLVSYRSRFKKLISNAVTEEAGNQAKAFARMMFLPEYEELRNSLCSMLERNPLALHRVWKLNNDYKSPKDVFRSISDHENRLQWQIHRIYRARNQLVHSG
ncbi:TM1812 family CRISPR-associated protein [Paraburkholderia youngii]|nr:TM1812 family CRISPR-associated protein [Paraburkholderia youngii]